MPYDTPSRITFMKYIELFVESTIFVSTMAPFVDQCVGPSWFRNIFPGMSLSTPTMLNSAWASFFTTSLLSTRIKIGTPWYGIVGYQPKLVAKWFGFNQLLPHTLYTRDTEICWYERKFIIEDYKACTVFACNQVLTLPTFQFPRSFYMTVQYHNWWTQYFEGHFPEEIFQKILTTSFSTVSDPPYQKAKKKLFTINFKFSYIFHFLTFQFQVNPKHKLILMSKDLPTLEKLRKNKILRKR